MDTDVLIVRRAIQGDEAALRSLWTRHAPQIDEAVAKLSPGARAVFVLHDVEGFTHEEIANDLGITTGGSKSQLFKARAKLRKLLAHLIDTTDRDALPALPSRDNKNVAPAY